jgi:hypothetical protein
MSFERRFFFGCVQKDLEDNHAERIQSSWASPQTIILRRAAESGAGRHFPSDQVFGHYEVSSSSHAALNVRSGPAFSLRPSFWTLRDTRASFPPTTSAARHDERHVPLSDISSNIAFSCR